MYHPRVEQWAHECIASFGDELVATEPVTGCLVDVAMSTYADDVTRTLLAPSPVDVLQTSIAPTFRWTKRCRQYPLDRMLKKQEHLPFFAGVGTDENMRRVFAKEFFPGNAKRAARYLIIWEPCCISRATSTWKTPCSHIYSTGLQHLVVWIGSMLSYKNTVAAN